MREGDEGGNLLGEKLFSELATLAMKNYLARNYDEKLLTSHRHN